MRAAARDAGVDADLLAGLPDRIQAVALDKAAEGPEWSGYGRAGAAAAERGVPLAALVQLYLGAAWRVWSVLLCEQPHDVGAAPPSTPSTSSIPATSSIPGSATRTATSTAVMQTVDRALTAVAAGYDDARRLAARREQAARREFVDDLLAGTGVLLGRAEGFGLRLGAPHRVVVVRADRVLADFGPVARALETDLAGRLGREDLLVASKDGLLACVLPQAAADDVPELIARRVTALEPGRSWRVAASRARPGAEGVRRGWQEARAALGLAGRLGMSSAVLRADDLLAHTLLLADPAAARDLVEHVLGPLHAARGGPEPLVDTLLALFDAGGSSTAAARALHLSVRAVAYRLDRVQELTGYRLDVPVQRYTLQQAAVAARLLGWGADRDQDDRAP